MQDRGGGRKNSTNMNNTSLYVHTYILVYACNNKRKYCIGELEIFWKMCVHQFATPWHDAQHNEMLEYCRELDVLCAGHNKQIIAGAALYVCLCGCMCVCVYYCVKRH